LRQSIREKDARDRAGADDRTGRVRIGQDRAFGIEHEDGRECEDEAENLSTMRRWRTIAFGCGCLLAIWSFAAFGVWAARALTPQAAPLIERLRGVSLVGRPEAERTAFINDLAVEMSRLGLDERRKLQFSAELRALFPQMSATERLYYLERTRPPGTGQMMKAFDRMTAERRRRHLGQALADVDTMGVDVRPHAVRNGLHQQIERVAREGLQAQDPASLGALELQPFVEQTQNVLQTAR